MKTKGKVTIIVYDVTGRILGTWHPELEDNSKLCHYSIATTELNWVNGNYLIVVSNGRETYRSKFAITK